MRKRDEQFVAELIRRVGESGELDDETLALTYQTSHGLPNGATIEASAKVYRFAVNAAKAKLQKTNIREALREVYEFAGFDIIEAMELHLKHIRGEFTKQQVTASGEIIELKIPPSYAALRDFNKFAFPQPAARVESRVKKVTETRVSISADPDVPQISSRSISDTVNTYEQDPS